MERIESAETLRTSPLRRPRLGLLSVSLGVGSALGASAFAQGNQNYVGNGYVFPTLHGAEVIDVRVLDLDQDGRADVAALDENGKLTITWNASATSWTSVHLGYTRMVVSYGATDRLFASNGSELIEILPDSGLTLTSGVEVSTGIDTNGAVAIHAARVGAVNRIAVIDEGGSHLLLYDAEGNEATLVQSVSPENGAFHDVVAIDWLGTGQMCFATLQDDGVHVIDSSGNDVDPNGFFPSTLDNAVLAVLPGEETQWGHDVLLFHHQPSPGAQSVLLAVNPFHAEYLPSPNVPLSGIAHGRFLDDAHGQILIVRSDEQEAWILKQATTASENSPFGYLDVNDTFRLLLTSSAGVDNVGTVTATTVGDLDHDGDDDVVSIDDAQVLLAMLSGTVDEEEGRPQILGSAEPSISGDTLSFAGSVDLPDGCDSLGIAVWLQIDDGNPATEDPLEETPLALSTHEFPANPQGVVGFSFTAPIPSGLSAASVFEIRLIPYDVTTGMRKQDLIGYWSNSAAVLLQLEVETEDVYPWDPEFLEGDDGTGGIVRRPKLGPPKPSGPKGDGAGPGAE